MDFNNENHFPGRYWHALEDDRIQCDLCPRYCRLHDGQRGFCFVRKNENSGIVLTTYGRSSGFCVDPVEKKPLNHFYPGSSVLSFGTAGCNLGCKFCQNWDISKSRETDTLADSASPEKIAHSALDLGCKAVAFTYNDPVIFAEYAIDIAQACHEIGIYTVAVTAGYITEEARGDFFDVMDAANVDLKAFTNEFYKKICLTEIEPILETLIYLKRETDVWFELTNLLIPGENDSDKELNEMSEWIAGNLGLDVPLHFSAFHPDFKMRDRPATPPATLSRARKIALSKGINYVYTGNVQDAKGGSSYCPGCKKLIIERDWYKLGEYNLKKNKCSSCGEEIAGKFENVPGSWGRKRMAVRLGDAL